MKPVEMSHKRYRRCAPTDREGPLEVGVEVKPENAKELVRVGMKILNSANKQVKVRHPEKKELDKLELVTFSSRPTKPEHHFKHANVYANTICVSPAGTSVSAKPATLVAKGELKVGNDLITESLVHPDLIMIGKAVEQVNVGDYAAVIPELSACSYLIGIQQCILETDDPIEYGFALGQSGWPAMLDSSLCILQCRPPV